MLDTPVMPKPFRQFVAHVCAYMVILKTWDEGDFSRVRNPVEYPDDLSAYIG